MVQTVPILTTCVCTLSIREFTIPMFGNDDVEFLGPSPMSSFQSAYFNGNFQGITDAFKIVSVGSGLKLADTNHGTSCSIPSAAAGGSCDLDANTRVAVAHVSADECAPSGSHGYRFNKTDIKTGHQVSICAIGDPVVNWNLKNAGDDVRLINSKITVKLELA
jgi:hypothetical protein